MSRFDEYDGPSRDEIAREVLDADEYGAWREVEAERARVRSVTRRNRDRLMRSQGDVWADEYRGPAA